MKRKVLHVVGRLDPGGVETWLLQLLQNVDRNQFEIDIAVTSNLPGYYDAKFREMGVAIHSLGSPKNLIRFWRNFAKANRTHGPYDIVHSHLHHFSGVVAFLGALHGIPRRITHSHSDTRQQKNVNVVRRTYLYLMKRLVQRFGTVHLAVGTEAAEALHGPGWKAAGNVHISRCGLDFDRFVRAQCIRGESRSAILNELEIPSDALVLGAVGRLVPVKNQTFLLDVLASLLADRPNTYLVLVGDGPLRDQIERTAKELDVHGNLRLMGIRQDVPEILTSVIDVLLLPSLYEGLPLVVLEAQAAGVPSLVSTRVTKECIVVEDLVERIPLEDGAERWAKEILNLISRERPSQAEALHAMLESNFSIRANVKDLARVYSMPAGPA